MVINEKQLLENFENDWVLINELTSICILKLPEYLNNVMVAVANKDFAKLELHAHTLKGSVSYFGYEPLREASHQLEIAGREKKTGGLDIQLSTLQQEFKVFYKDLEELAQKAYANAA
ncbi:MAG: Hpt domain-containing protein [Pseudomonadota bacterium]|nr:Hpt domain-containing protein [Pseudomonadota bacterium]